MDVAQIAADNLRVLGHPKVAEDIESRIKMGERKYGTRLKSHNGRNAMLDLYQEILDSLNYATQCKVEGLDDGGLFANLVGMAVLVSGRLHDRTAAEIESESH